jgi:hypothetical protein
MRIALILRGIHYLEDYEHKYGIPKYTIDFHDTLPSIQENVIKAFESQGHIIDVFLLSYHSKFENELIETLKPKNYHFTNYRRIALGLDQQDIGYHLILDYHINGINMVEEYEQQNNIKYDTILITRFDLYYYKKVTDINLDHSCINYPFMHMAGPQRNILSSEDNFIYFPRDKIIIIKDALLYLKKNFYEARRHIWYNTHNLGEYLLSKGETIKYLYGEKGDGAYDYPIYKFGRHIFGNVKEYTIEDNIAVPMNRIYHSEEERRNPQPIYLKI